MYVRCFAWRSLYGRRCMVYLRTEWMADARTERSVGGGTGVADDLAERWGVGRDAGLADDFAERWSVGRDAGLADNLAAGLGA